MNARTDTWRASVAALAETFAARAAEADDDDRFVAENYVELRASGLLSAGVPAELGGLGLELEPLAEMLRTLARACSSTALAFSMHTHQVALAAWRWRHQKAPVAPLLERIARERVVLVSTGGGDWLESSGEATPVDGGFRVTARKPFCSGAPAGDVLLTTAIVRGAGEVVHFTVPMTAEGVRIHDNWRTLGMRGTGSHDVSLENVFVPEGAVAVRRAQGQWHMFFHLVSMISLPLIYSAYVGIAEAARERALVLVKRRRPDDHLLQLVGEMENQLAAAQSLHASWTAFGAASQPSLAATSRSVIFRTLVGRAVLATVEAAMNVAGGASFFRANGIERLFRDAQGARYHPLQEGLQKVVTARAALGIES